MLFDYETLKIIWWCLVGVLLIGFALTGGMDMAVSFLSLIFGKTSDQRRYILKTIAPHWEGNQVWLITAGGAIFAAWPDVYAASFSGLYWAMIIVLMAIWLRPLAFDYRNQIDSPSWHKRWDIALAAGSAVPLVIFGVAFGNLLLGLPFYADNDLVWHYQSSKFGTLLPLLSPFALLCGVISLCMLICHALMWLGLRGDETVREKAQKAGVIIAPLTVILYCIAGIYAYFLNGYEITSAGGIDLYHSVTSKTVVLTEHGLFANYADYPVTTAVPAVAGLSMILAAILFKKGQFAKGIIATSCSVACTIATPAVALFPFIMPSSVSPESSLCVYDATSSEYTLNAMLIAAIIFVPVFLSYTVWAYVKMWKHEQEEK
ncbi:MAG: cytochrome d ubiquinol oxidase subunit II [Succinivibrio sp.]